MSDAVCAFRTSIVGASSAARSRLEVRARKAIERLSKQFKHKIDDMVSRRSINERERLGLEKQLRLALEGAIRKLEHAVRNFNS